MSQLVALFRRPQLSAWDVVDILIVSILIYEALKLIRGTRAMQMAIGSLLVIGLLATGWLIREGYLIFTKKGAPHGDD